MCLVKDFSDKSRPCLLVFLSSSEKRIVIISSLQKKTTPAKRKISGLNSLVAVKPRGVVSDAYKHTLCSFPPLLAVGTRPLCNLPELDFSPAK